jgi:hypothetical protein
MGLQGIQVVMTVEQATDAEVFSSLGSCLPPSVCRPLHTRKGVRSVPYPSQPQVGGCQSPHLRVRDGLRDPGS